MQIKTIRKNIEAKLEDWLSSITDTTLVLKLRNNILVSGGSICSLFFNEQVNDYDVYIMDMDVLKELIIYYTKGKGGIEIFDGRELKQIIKELNEDDHSLNVIEVEDKDEMYFNDNIRAISLRNLKEDQLKLFFTNKEPGLKYDIDENDTNRLKYQVVYLSPNAISLSDNLQIVIRFWGNAEEIHKNYDFIHATNYFTFKDGLVTNIKALESLLTKQLKYQGSLYPVTSIIRIKKFLKRGWNINAGEMLKIIFQCSLLDLTNPDVLEEQLIGVDVAYFGILINALRNIKDETKLDSCYLNTLIDKIFDGNEEDSSVNYQQPKGSWLLEREA